MATPNTRVAPILVVAALDLELAPLKRAKRDGLALLETGEGTLNAARELESWLSSNQARAVLSIGFAGGLSPELGACDLVVATEVRIGAARPDATLLSAAARIKVAAPMHFSVAFTSDRILWKSAEKRALASSLGSNETGFVDMESTSIAAVCSRHDVPFAIIRSITDPLDEDLPLDFNQYRNADGRVDTSKVMKAALLRPASLPGLIELRRRSQLCAERIAEFVLALVELMP